MFAPVEKFLGESTVHSLAHTIGDRRLYVKLLWLAALVVSFAFCSVRVNEAIVKYLSREVSTTVKEAALDFEFPDVHICNENPISGSLPVTLGSADNDLLNQYRRLVNETAVSNVSRDSLEIYALRLVNSLPYQFLSDRLGHQTWQTVIDLTLDDASKRKTVPVTVRRSSYLNCIRLNLSEADRNRLRSPSSRLSLTLFADPQVPPPVDNSTQQDIFSSSMGTTNLKPSDWDFNYGYDYSRSNGFRVFITPRGVQPSDWTSQFVVGAGQKHEISLTMEDVTAKPEDFVGKCLDTSQQGDNIEYANPYSGEKETFKYEFDACMYREMARASQDQLNCLVGSQPLPWEYRQLPSCFNVTAVRHLKLAGLYSRYGSIRNALTRDAITTCRSQVPCKRRFYAFSKFSTNWPSERLMAEYLSSFINYQMLEDPVDSERTHLPGIAYLLNGGSAIKARESLVQMTLMSDDEKSTETQMSIAYSFNSLIADMGGLLGLFLGMSLLSLLELLELLHDCVMYAHRYRKTEPESQQQQQQDPKEMTLATAPWDSTGTASASDLPASRKGINEHS